MPTASVFLNAAMLDVLYITKMRNTQGVENGLVRQAKRLRRRSPKGHQRSLRDVATELAKPVNVGQVVTS